MIRKRVILLSFLLRISIAIPFLYAAIASFLQPESWIGFMPLFLQDLLPSWLLLGTFSVYELGLTLWLLSGKKTYQAALLSSITLCAITLFNLGALDIVFRDIGLLFAALGLVLLHT